MANLIKTLKLLTYPLEPVNIGKIEILGLATAAHRFISSNSDINCSSSSSSSSSSSLLDCNQIEQKYIKYKKNMHKVK